MEHNMQILKIDNGLFHYFTRTAIQSIVRSLHPLNRRPDNKYN